MKQIRVVGAALVAALVAFSSAVQAAVDTGKFGASVTFTASGYSGSETLANFPMLVKLSESIKDFRYSDCPQASIRFADADGNLIPHEVDVWDATGTSYLWVSVPSLSGNATAVKMYYGGDGADEPASTDNVWTLANFKSVWHLNIADGATSDSVASYAGTLLNPNTYCGAGTGIVGGDYLNVENLVNHSIKVTNMSAFTANPAGVVTYSAWVRQVGGSSISTKPDPDNYPQIQWGSWGNCGAIWNSKNAQTSGNQGIELCLEGGKTNPQQFQRMVLRDSANTGANLNSALPNGLYDKQWHYVVVRYDGTNRQLIIDGVTQSNFSSAGTVATPQGTVRMGGRVDTNADCVWTGDLDEMRYRQGCTSDDWLVAETANVGSYDTFVTAVQEPMDETTIKFESAPTATKSANGFTVSVKVTGGAGSLSVIYGTEYPYANTNQVAASVSVGETYSLELTGLTADRCYGFGVVGVGTSGVVTENLGEGGFLTGEIGIAKTSDADESHLNTPGVFTVTRPSTATADDMVVKYAVSGTAVAGTHYVALPGTVTIPAGAASATVEVYPLASYTGEHSLTLTLSEGPYGIGAGAATMAIRSFTAESGFAKKIVLTASGYTGATTLENFPLLVRLSPSINGFSYADFQLANGGDLRFATEDGVPLVHEIDTWNPEGESLVWVKVPALAKDTQIVAYYGNVDPWAVTAADVWANNYLGVWHFNVITDGTTPDATGNNLGMVAKTASVQVAAEGGQIGKSIVNCTSSGGSNGGFLSPTYTDKFTSNKFTLSAWFNRNGKGMNGYERYFSSKAAHGDANGFEMEDKNGSATELTARGSASDSVAVKVPDQSKAGWNKITLVYDGSKLTAYTNGAPSAVNQTVTTVVHSKGFAVGNNAARNERALLGNIDEVRFAKSCESADWVKAEYDTEAKAGFLTTENGVEPVDASAVKFAAKPILSKSGNVFKVNVTAASDSGTGVLTAVCEAEGEAEKAFAVSDVVVPNTVYEGTLTGLTADKSYRAGFKGVNDKETETRAYAMNVFFNGALAITKGDDADEKELTRPGTVTVSRADAYGDLIVNYTVGGTAVAGTHYVALPGAIVIPDGATSATIEIWPIRTKTEDHTVEITLTDGLYFLDEQAKTTAITVKKLVAPAGWNTWLATAADKASVAANWSDGVPKAGDKILFDGRYSTADCEWDVITTESSKLAAWKQTEGYAGKVSVNTEFPTYSGATFTCLYVSGDVQIDTGTLTHPVSIYQTSGKAYSLAEVRANAHYRLRLDIGGALTIGSSGRIDATEKGYWRYATGSNIYGSHAANVGNTYPVYGNPKEPVDIGVTESPGTDALYKTSAGGGAVYVTVAGTATINGEVAADGSDNGAGGSSAGSVYLRADSFAGSGKIHASGRKPSTDKSAGSAGRVAVVSAKSISGSLSILAASQRETGCGTVYLKDASSTYGRLLLKNPNNAAVNASSKCGARVTGGSEGDWTFDGVVFGGGNVQLCVLPGTTLTLPNGFASVTCESGVTTRAGGITYYGGMISVGPGNQTLSGKWYFQPVSNYTFAADVALQNGAYIGFPAYFNQTLSGNSAPSLDKVEMISCSVAGDMTVDATSGFSTEQSGPTQQSGQQFAGVSIGCHGGKRAGGYTMGSVFNPLHAPVGQNNSYDYMKPGAAMKISVGGKLTMNGTATANPVNSQSGGYDLAAGGSLNFTVGELEGSGSFVARGFRDRQAGGRIAVRLTKSGADFGDFSGTFSAQTYSGAKSSSPGSVYLQAGDDGELCGTVVFDNLSSSLSTNTIPICATGYAADAVSDFKKASLVVRGGATAQVSVADEGGNFKMRGLSMTSPAALDLCGHAFTVTRAKLGDTKLKPGTYTAESAEVAGFVTDSAGGGSLVVKSIGMAIIIR